MKKLNVSFLYVFGIELVAAILRFPLVQCWLEVLFLVGHSMFDNYTTNLLNVVVISEITLENLSMLAVNCRPSSGVSSASSSTPCWWCS